ncbi:MAG: LPS-assembly protein LptD, partial [Puniceicoccales bacterium]|nr:LPS-assembly protein LptD [Puniceicoccales bacterium]
VHWWSDSEILHNFYYNRHEQDPFPDHFIETNYRHKHALTTCFTRVPLHRFQSSTQRLPSLRFEYFPRSNGESSFYQQGFLDFTHLHQEDGGEIFLKSQEKNAIHARRTEVAYQIAHPFSWDHFLQWTPLLGFHGTSYTSLPQKKTFHRALGQIGFDLNFNFYRSMSSENALWGIRGLRHILHPILQYRWIPSSEHHWDRIPAIDNFTQDTHLPVIDLMERRDVDRLYRSHIMRIGIENFLQTASTTPYLARDLATFHIYQDIYPQRPIVLELPNNQRIANHHLSDTHVHFQVSPAEFLHFQAYTRIDPNDRTWKEFNTSCKVLSGDIWQIQFWNRYLRRRTQVYATEFSGNLNAVTRWEIFFQWDARRHRLEEHRYSLIREVSQTWDIEVKLRFDHRDSRKQRTSFSISCHLLRW